MDLADRIKSRMTDLGLTQEALANRADISQAMVYKLLSRKSKGTSKLVPLAEALECSIEWLATGKTTPAIQETSAEYLPSIDIQTLKAQLNKLSAKEQKAIALELMEGLIDEKS